MELQVRLGNKALIDTLKKPTSPGKEKHKRKSAISNWRKRWPVFFRYRRSYLDCMDSWRLDRQSEILHSPKQTKTNLYIEKTRFVVERYFPPKQLHSPPPLSVKHFSTNNHIPVLEYLSFAFVRSLILRLLYAPKRERSIKRNTCSICVRGKNIHDRVVEKDDKSWTTPLIWILERTYAPVYTEGME